MNDNKETEKTCHAELVSASNQFTKDEKTLNQVQGDKKYGFTPLVKAFRSGWDSLLCRWHSQARNPRIPSFANAHSSAFTLLVKHFRSNPLTALLRSRQSRFSQTKYRNFVAHLSAFTLAEVLITLSIIGIIAAITIPSLVKNQTETANRSKLKKSMAAYEKAINQMLIDNGLETESAFKSWAKRDAQNGYTGERSYFNIAEESQNYSPCRFKTKDGIWWDICGTNDSNIENTIIVLDKAYKDTPRTGDNGLEALAKTEKDANGKKIYVFALVGHRDVTTGSVRVNDKEAEKYYPTKSYMEKLYSFIFKIESDNNKVSPFSEYNKNCDSGNVEIGEKCKIKTSYNGKIEYRTRIQSKTQHVTYSVDGSSFNCNNLDDPSSCESSYYSITDSNGKWVKLTCNGDGTICDNSCTTKEAESNCYEYGFRSCINISTNYMGCCPDGKTYHMETIVNGKTTPAFCE